MPIIVIIPIAVALAAAVVSLGFHLDAREKQGSRSYRAAADARRSRNAVFLVTLFLLVVAFVAWLVTL